jgi:glycosyltransferase involved in cell wall biosynthesis
MIVRNEEKNLKRCLNSVRNVVDEMIIVDTGSTDKTRSIAGNYGARVIDYKWKNDFADARNAGLGEANSRWILHLDADERLKISEPLILRTRLMKEEADGLTLPVRNYQPDQDLVHFLDDPQIRIFRGDKGYRYQQAVHEQIGTSIFQNQGKVHTTDFIIEHFGYMDDPRIKAERNLPILESLLETHPRDPYIRFKMGETLKALDRFDAAREQFLEVLRLNYGSLPAEIVDTMLLRLGQIELAADNYQEALKYCLEGLRINPNNLLSMYVLSIALIYLGETDRVPSYLKRIRELNRDGKIDPDDLDKLETVCRTMKNRLIAS